MYSFLYSAAPSPTASRVPLGTKCPNFSRKRLAVLTLNRFTRFAFMHWCAFNRTKGDNLGCSTCKSCCQEMDWKSLSAYTLFQCTAVQSWFKCTVLHLARLRVTISIAQLASLALKNWVRIHTFGDVGFYPSRLLYNS